MCNDNLTRGESPPDNPYGWDRDYMEVCRENESLTQQLKNTRQGPLYTILVEQNIELKQQKYDLSVALRKSRDTFVDTALALRLLRHDVMAQAMDIAAEYIKTVLETATQQPDQQEDRSMPRIRDINGNTLREVDLGWLPKHWNAIKTLEFRAYPDGGGLLIAELINTNHYRCNWADESVFRRWIDRPVFRGLPLLMNGNQITV